MNLLEWYYNLFPFADLTLHFMVGALISLFCIKVLKLNDIGIILTIIIAILKELWDFNNAGSFLSGSFIDFTSTLIGSMIVEILFKRSTK